MAEIYFEASDWDEWIDGLGQAADLFMLEVDKALAKIGEEIVVAAKAKAQSEGSDSIPPTIEIAGAMPGAVMIDAGSEKVALAALWEKGNKGASSRSDTFRHPVFATGPRNTWTWTTQKRHPFMRPAIRSIRKQISQELHDAWDRGFAPLKLR